MNLISLLKKLPIDLGQAEYKHGAAEKMIALSLIPKSGEGLVALDMGCRDGYWSERIKEFGYTVISLDIEPKYQEAIKHDLENGLPFGNNYFDLIWCTDVIEHLHKPDFLIREIGRTLKTGGTAIITTPNSAFWFYHVVKLWGWTPQKLQNADHKQFFDLRGIKKLASGYQIYGYFPYLNFFFFKIKKLVGFLSPTFIMVNSKNESV
ncbi:MAG: class I SAM-dependent methyltransferase [bacterium]|nr:class I SAM-dependent methyltransferase [bacterium]